jgi:hypothetical protein
VTIADGWSFFNRIVMSVLLFGYLRLMTRDSGRLDVGFGFLASCCQVGSNGSGVEVWAQGHILQRASGWAGLIHIQ